MKEFIFTLPRDETLSLFSVVKLVESTLGRKLSGISVHLVSAFAFAILTGLVASLGSFVIDAIFFDLGTSLVEKAIESANLLGFITTVTFLLTFLYMAVPIWFDKVAVRYNNLATAFTLIISTIAIIVSVMILIGNPLTVSKQQSSEVPLPDLCERTVNCEPKLHVVEGALEGEVSLKEQLKNFGLSEDMTPDEFSQWLQENGGEDYKISERTTLYKKSFNEISLFRNKDKATADWEQFFITLDETSTQNPMFISSVIANAISDDIPFDVLVELLNRGYSLNSHHVTMLASRLSVDEFKVLENYGVDLAMHSKHGQNTLVQSLLNREEPDVFDFFLEREPMVHSGDIETLKQVMQLSSMLGLDFSYAQKVIDKGVDISDETVRWINEDLKQINKSYYEKAKEAI